MNRTIYKCEYCSIEFKSKDSRPKRYCSRSCAALGSTGKNNPRWKADKVGSSGVHRWVKINYPKPNNCNNCGIESALDLANISVSYDPKTYTRDINNWSWLCRTCHMKTDGRLERLAQTMKTSAVAQCPQCHDEFIKVIQFQKYCSKDCAKLTAKLTFRSKTSAMPAISSDVMELLMRMSEAQKLTKRQIIEKLIKDANLFSVYSPSYDRCK